MHTPPEPGGPILCKNMYFNFSVRKFVNPPYLSTFPSSSFNTVH